MGSVTDATRSQRRPVEGDDVKDIVPDKPFRGVTVIGVLQGFGNTHWTVVADEGEMSKSGAGTVTVIVTFWFKDPLVPVTLTRYVPGAMLVDAARLS